MNALDLIVEKQVPQSKKSQVKKSRTGKKVKKIKKRTSNVTKEPFSENTVDETNGRNKNLELAMKKLIEKKATSKTIQVIKPTISARRRSLVPKRKNASKEKVPIFGELKRQKSNLKKKFDDRKKLEEMLNFARYNIARLSTSTSPKTSQRTPVSSIKPKIIKKKLVKTKNTNKKEDLQNLPEVPVILKAKPKKKLLFKKRRSTKEKLLSGSNIPLPNKLDVNQLPEMHATLPVATKFEQKMSTVYETLEKESSIVKNIQKKNKKKIIKPKQTAKVD